MTRGQVTWLLHPAALPPAAPWTGKPLPRAVGARRTRRALGPRRRRRRSGLADHSAGPAAWPRRAPWASRRLSGPAAAPRPERGGREARREGVAAISGYGRAAPQPASRPPAPPPSSSRLRIPPPVTARPPPGLTRCRWPAASSPVRAPARPPAPRLCSSLRSAAGQPADALLSRGCASGPGGGGGGGGGGGSGGGGDGVGGGGSGRGRGSSTGRGGEGAHAHARSRTHPHRRARSREDVGAGGSELRAGQAARALRALRRGSAHEGQGPNDSSGRRLQSSQRRLRLLRAESRVPAHTRVLRELWAELAPRSRKPPPPSRGGAETRGRGLPASASGSR